MDMYERRSGSTFTGMSTSRAPAVIAAQVFGITAGVLMLVWLLHFRGGLDLNSQNKDKIFNMHPFLMFLGVIFTGGQAIMAYTTVWAKKNVQKFVHMLLHLIAIILGTVGIHAVFKFHNESGIANMYSLHSWLGIITICLYGLQWLFGFLFFWLPHAEDSTRKRVHPLHRIAGMFIFLTAICAAVTGLTERFVFSRLQRQPEARVINFTGLFIVLYGFSVCFVVTR